MSKITMVTLCCPAHNITQDFEISHAERLLRLSNNGGWQLPEKTSFEFDKENGLRYKKYKKPNSRTEETDCDK